jgi:hypothetical protein
MSGFARADRKDLDWIVAGSQSNLVSAFFSFPGFETGFLVKYTYFH